MNKYQSNCGDMNSIEQYFLDIFDSIILYSDMHVSITNIKSLIEIISSKEEVFVLLDKIEDMLESIVTNIIEDASICIIRDQIEQVRILLPTVPDNYSDIGLLILNILDSVTTSFNFNALNKKIMYIKEVMITDMNEYNSIEHIHSTILSILSNIENGASNFIIKQRVDYLQTLIVTA